MNDQRFNRGEDRTRLTPQQLEAANQYRRDRQKAEGAQSPESRLAAQQAVRNARNAIGASAADMLDQIAIKGLSVAGAARHAELSSARMKRQYLQALNQLADHYASSAAGDEA